MCALAGNRTSVTYLLQLNFGDTFTPGAHFYDNPGSSPL
jgi:hypothetical protein